MAKGIIYITTTSVTGLIKIGRCESNRFDKRMNELEQNGYWNVGGLKRYFAVEVDDYCEKEKLMHTLFSKSQVSTSELFALDKDLAKQMLSAFEGKQIYPSPTQQNPIPKPKNGQQKAPRFSFKMLGIPVGSELVFIPDSSHKCIVKNDDNIVEYKGKDYTLSKLAEELKGKSLLQGPAYFTYNGESLIMIRKRKGV